MIAITKIYGVDPGGTKMKIEVRYFSRGGNTKKIAEAIAKGCGEEAKSIQEPLKESVDILFLGSAPYAFDIDNEVKNFISGIRVHVGKVVNFSTSAVIKSTHKYVARVLDEKGIPLADEEFACKGAFAIFHRGRPNAADCEMAAQFAAKVVAEEEQRLKE